MLKVSSCRELAWTPHAHALLWDQACKTKPQPEHELPRPLDPGAPWFPTKPQRCCTSRNQGCSLVPGRAR